MKKLLALLLALVMVISLAACVDSSTDGEDNKKEDIKPTEPEVTEPQATEVPAVEELDTVSYFMLILQQGDSTRRLDAYDNGNGTARVEFTGDVIKKGNFDISVLEEITYALERSGLSLLESPEEMGEGVDYASMYIVCGEDRYLSADYYGEIPEEYIAGYNAMEKCFAEITADLDEYVPSASENGIIADADRQALNEILANMDLPDIEAFMISGVEKGELFSYTMGLSNADNVSTALSFAPMMMTNPYSLNLVTLNEGIAVETVAADFQSNIDWTKWVCVQPDGALIATKGNQVLCMLGGAELFEMTANAITAAGWTTYATMENPSAE